MLKISELSKKLLTKMRILKLKPWDLIRLGLAIKALFFDE